MKMRIAFFLLLAIWSCGATYAQSIDYEFNAGSQYNYYPTDFLPIQVDDFFFSINGTFTLNQDIVAGQANITNADVQLTGLVPSDPDFIFSTEGGVESWLESIALVPGPSIGTQTLWQLENTNLFRNFGILIDNVAANQFATISGGFDHRPADGDGIEFIATASAVPEPSCLTLLFGICLVAIRSSRFTWRTTYCV